MSRSWPCWCHEGLRIKPTAHHRRLTATPRSILCGQVLAEYFIGANKFIGGSSPSIADMAIAPTLYFLQVAKYEASQNTRKRRASGVRTRQRVRFARCCEGLKRVLCPAVVREYVWPWPAGTSHEL